MVSMGPIVVGLVFTLLYAFFLSWYGGRGKPLAPAETEGLLAEIRRRAGRAAQTEESPLLQQFRDLAESDDGREYYMVNPLKFRAQALYPSGSPYSDDPLAANARYNRAIVPLLFKHGGVPILDSVVAGRFIHPDAADEWDRVGLVRYRSRRDMLKMAADVAGRGVDIHKWAALERTHVFPVKPLVSLAVVRGMVALSLCVAGLVLHLLLSGLTVY